MKTLPMGSTAVLVEDPIGGPARWSFGLRSLDLVGVVEIVPAARTVLVSCASEVDLRHAVDHFVDVIVDDDEAALGPSVTIPVVYDGADLADVAAATGLSIDEAIALHAQSAYEVAFCGFAPGFAYMVGLPGALHLPRLDTPRTRVPAGSVAIAAEYAAVYPRSSPGGWHLIGTTDAELFDPHRDPPALLVPGTRVTFERVA